MSSSKSLINVHFRSLMVISVMQLTEFSIVHFSYKPCIDTLLVSIQTGCFWQSVRQQMLTIGSTWIYSFAYPLVLVIPSVVIYIPMTIRSVKNRFYLYRNVRNINKHSVISNALIHARRELQMTRRIAILVTILFAVLFRYISIVFMSFFVTPQKYHFQTLYAFMSLSILSILIALVRFTEPLKAVLMKTVKKRSDMVKAIHTELYFTCSYHRINKSDLPSPSCSCTSGSKTIPAQQMSVESLKV